MQYQFILNEVEGKATLTIVIGGVPTQVDDSHPAFDEIVEGLGKLSAQQVRELLDSNRRIQKQLRQFGNVTVDDSGVSYKGEPVNGLLADRMIQMLESGMDIRPWALFLENLQKNPAKHAVDELFLWLERGRMPITERGNFLAYKKVKDDYTSYHPAPGGQPFRNDIGTFVDMPRNKVDDNRHRTCSQGLHFCSWDYLPSYMGSSGKVVLVEINPAHVVSIPSDYNNAKGRAEGYMIVGEIPQEECKHAFPDTLYVSDDNQYIQYEWDETDFGDIDEGWFVEDWDEIEEDDEEEYEIGYNYGFSDGYGDEPNDASSLESGSYRDGYLDGFYEGVNAREADDFIDDEEDDEDDSKYEWDDTYTWPTPFRWTRNQIAFRIENGDMTISEFVRDFAPNKEDLLEILSRV